jgi:NADH-quinone oxidoreductase subunit G
MGKVTIDEVVVEVPDNTNLMEVARIAGVDIPHFCWHPGLSIAGQCRMCLVEIEGVPKVQPACNSFAKDGLVVRTKSEKVKEAQRAVMEFLLVNHPLDCPICDQAGECKLQDNSFGFGQGSSRYTIGKRQYPTFDRTMIGPHVIADMTRCIQCTRCIRFCREVTGTGELSFQERGGRTLVWTHEGRPLDNELSGCAADVCPVGALTVKEFRFRARVWFLDKTKSVCPGCEVGCSISIESKDRIAYRFLPRENGAVNDWWMCDFGRLLVEGFNRRDIVAPRKRGENGDVEISAEEGFAEVARRLVAAKGAKKRIVLLAPATLSNEALWLAKRLAAATNAEFLGFVPKGETLHRVKNGKEWIEGHEAVPNGEGSRRLGFADPTDLLEGKGAEPAVVVVLDADIPELALDGKIVASLRRAGELIVFGRLKSPLSAAADVLLPLSPFMEGEGSWVNGRGRIQRLERSWLPQGGARPAWELLCRIGRLIGGGFDFTTAGEVFDELQRMEAGLGAAPPFASIPETGADFGPAPPPDDPASTVFVKVKK